MKKPKPLFYDTRKRAKRLADKHHYHGFSNGVFREAYEYAIKDFVEFLVKKKMFKRRK